MRILLAAKFVPSGPRPIGGVQSWIRTARAELERMGHEVSEWEAGGQALTELFDLGVFANMSLTGHLATLCKRTVCVSHGIIEPERPGRADVTYFVSEGVRRHWEREGQILRQPIDLDFWRPTGAKRTGVIRYSYRQSRTLCADAAKALGMPYWHLSTAVPQEARDALAGAALVFASGRAALEAMACGAPTVIYDHRSAYQGPLMDDFWPRQMENSYSGRGGFDPSLADLLRTSETALETGGNAGRSWVRKNHDAKKIVANLLN